MDCSLCVCVGVLCPQEGTGQFLEVDNVLVMFLICTVVFGRKVNVPS